VTGAALVGFILDRGTTCLMLIWANQLAG